MNEQCSIFHLILGNGRRVDGGAKLTFTGGSLLKSCVFIVLFINAEHVYKYVWPLQHLFIAILTTLYTLILVLVAEANSCIDHAKRTVHFLIIIDRNRVEHIEKSNLYILLVFNERDAAAMVYFIIVLQIVIL
jgi:hypothetical protein